MKRALVTGATGFVGSALAARLVADGVEVTCLVRPGSDTSRIPAGAMVLPVTADSESVAQAVARSTPEVVFHLASYFVAEHGPSDVDPLAEANLAFGMRLLDAMDRAGVNALVYAGTIWQHFNGAAYDPVSLYAATKQAFADIALFYANARGMRLLTLSLTDTYGPHDPRKKLFSLLREAHTDGRVLSMSPGEQVVDPVYIDDAVEAFILGGDRLIGAAPGAVEEYAVRTEAPQRLRDLVDVWQAVTGKHLSIEWGGRSYRAREVMAPWAGPVLPGWRARVTLEEGISRMEGIRR